MIITINIQELSPEIRNAYYDKTLKSVSLDYAEHALLGYIDDNEVLVYDFKPALKFDNRWNGNELTFFEHHINLRLT